MVLDIGRQSEVDNVVEEPVVLGELQEAIVAVERLLLQTHLHVPLGKTVVKSFGELC